MLTRMKELRAMHKLTQAELARRVNVRRETIVFLEKGEYNPSLKLAMKIAKQLDARIEDVFILEEEDLR
ncbi:helix-turn-helix transcriptional regulator [Alkalihalobacillus sp. R86527]|uniref:helix-turn-helix transcriptional regulator n=1 Tax=Alkalihalobacillus sp. R86527 TaxID=3093863 RepID=UPI003673419B